jgi:hypothetical protein
MNRTRKRIAIVALPLVAFGVGLGCLGQAERTYFDDLLDGAADGTTTGPDVSPGDDSSNPVDSSAPVDSSVSDVQIVTGDDGPIGMDAPVARDGGSLDGGFDASIDAPVETGCGPTNTVTNCGQCGAACDTVTGSPTACTAGSCKYTCNSGLGDCNQGAPNTNGCETPLNTTTDCTGCGVACDTTHSNNPSCNGTSCNYGSCAAGWRDCNSTPPNTNGCECQAPGCCGDGSVCEPLHDNGQGNSFYDCTPLGQYSSALALKACIAYTDAASQCVGFPCANPDAGPIICSSGALTKFCMCWSYAGTNIGLVDNAGETPGISGKNCFCPDLASGDTPWQ